MRYRLAIAITLLLGLQSLVMVTSHVTAEKPQEAAQVAATTETYRFISWGDAQDENGNLSVTAAQASSLNPAFTLFNGDLENDGVVSSRMDVMLGAFGSLSSQTFLIRGNHDDHVASSAGLWENYFTALNRPLPSGVTNYVSMNSSTVYLDYSFDYGNARFIGVDVPGDADLLTSAELSFLDARLTNAEASGFTHAFIFFHGPEYCVESTHCNCSAAADGSCTPGGLVTVINKHPIVSATFHGHEHVLGWVHMDSTRVASLTHPYEEFLTSPSGGWTYNEYVYPARMDYYYPNMGSSQGFAAIDVNGASFTINFYKVGVTAPVWSKSFTKPGSGPTFTPSVTPAVSSTPTTAFTKTKTATVQPGSTSTRRPSRTPTRTPTKTRTSVGTPRTSPVPGFHFVFIPLISRGGASARNTPVPPDTQTPIPLPTNTPVPGSTHTVTPTRTATRTATRTVQPTPTTPAPTRTPGSGGRTLKYYMADRVVNNADFARLAGWGINTAMVDFDVNGSATVWRAVFTEAAKYNIDIVIWPTDWNNPRPNCDWEAPYPVSTNGDITKVKPLLDVASQYPNFIGIINGHESFWTCTNMTFDEMAGLKTQLKAYALSKGREIKVWNYINSLYTENGDPAFPAVEIPRVMDVAITWKHCAGNAEGTCDTGSYSALKMIQSDRARLQQAGLDGRVELVYVMDTFTMGSGYETKFTLPQLENYSCEFLNTNALDGFGFYTWDAGWWPDLSSWTDLQPAVPYIHDTCAQMAP